MATSVRTLPPRPQWNLLFVCLGNICRSPAAEGIMRHLVRQAGLDDRVSCDSAGMIDFHAGKPADARMRAAAGRRGILVDSSSRPVSEDDFHRFDLLVAMDESNLAGLRQAAPDQAARARIRLILDFSPNPEAPREVPDPYYGGDAGFDHVLDLLEDACAGLLEAVRTSLQTDVPPSGQKPDAP